MKFERLLSEKKIEKVEKKDFTSDSFEKSIEFAKNGFKTENYDEIMSVVYNAVFKISNRLMNFLGYRAIGKEHHKNLFEFLRETGLNEELVDYFNKIRVKRNNFVYRDIENISKEEAEEIIEKAKEIVQQIRTFVQKNRTGEKEKEKTS